MKQMKFWMLAILVYCVANLSFASCSSDDDNTTESAGPTVSRIQERGTLLVGTTGDYRPLSYREDDGQVRSYFMANADCRRDG